MEDKKTIEEITGQTEISRIIEKLRKANQLTDPKVLESCELIDVDNSDIFNKIKRPDKIVNEYEGDEVISSKTEYVNRIGIPFASRIVNTSVAFAFGNPVKWTLNSSNEEDKKYFDAYMAVLKMAKYDSIDKLMCKALKSYSECAELWYAIEGEPHTKYGFPTTIKLKCLVLDFKNSKLYPYFDEYGDLKAFCREYKIERDNKEVILYDVITAYQILRYENSNNGYILIDEKENKLGKIHVVYNRQDKTEFQDVQSAINRLMLIMSNHADTNDYHSSPTLFGKGEFPAISKKGEQGKFFVGQVNSTLEYVTWDSAPESMKLEIENLYRIIFEFTQTPNFSFEQVKGLGAISGVSLKLMFLDAHLKVVHDKVIYDAWMDRRKSIILSYLGQIDSNNKSKYESLDISHEIRPYMIDDRKGLIDEIVSANGNKPFISIVRSMQMLGDIPNPDDEYKQILQEENDMNTSNLFAPAQ